MIAMTTPLPPSASSSSSSRRRGRGRRRKSPPMTTPTPTPTTPNPCPDAWMWEARYLDGTTLPEFTWEAKEQQWKDHGWAEVDKDRLAAFALIPMRPGLPSHMLALNPLVSGNTTRFIFFRRRMGVMAPPGALLPADRYPTGTATCTVLGWQRTIVDETGEPRNVSSFTAFL